MLNSCPISFSLVNEKVVRIQAGLISFAGIIYILYPSNILLLLLFVDFLVRSCGCKEYSVLLHFSLYIYKVCDFEEKNVNSGPKQFATKIGFIFVSISVVLFMFSFIKYSLYTMSILVLCALLEACFGFCVACRIYPYMRRILK